MSLVPRGATSSQEIHSFAAALQQLASRDGQLTPPLEDFLAANASRLARCWRPYKQPNASSRSKLETGKLTEAGESSTLQARGIALAKDIADKLVLDELEAGALLQRFRIGKGEDVAADVEAALGTSDDFWSEITSHVLEEQLRCVQLVAFLLRLADFEIRVPPEVVQRFAKDVTTPQFAQELLSRASELATTSIPSSAIPYSRIWAKFWVQQQKALLEVYFLLYYSRLFPNGASLSKILDFVKLSQWCSVQVNEGLFDGEAQIIAQDVSVLAHLVLLENLNLERAASPLAEELAIVPDQQRTEEELLHPVTLQRVHSAIIELVQLFPRESALLALSWAFVLFRISDSMTSVPLPESYYTVAQQILPSDLHPRTEHAAANANTSAQAVWQSLVTHALSPSVSALSLLLNLLTSPLLSNSAAGDASGLQSDPNVAGYLSVSRSALAAVPRLVQPSYLPPSDFDALVSVFEAVYSNSEAALLRGSFWGVFEGSDENPIRDEEWQIFDLAVRRFPVESDAFIRILQAVSGGRANLLLSSPLLEDGAHGSGTDDIAHLCVQQTLQYLSHPQTLTQALPPISPVMPLPYEPSRNIHAGPNDIVAVRPLNISPTVVIPAGTAGRIVSPRDQRPLIVCWDISHISSSAMSSLRYFGDVLQEFVASMSIRSQRTTLRGRQTKPDVFQANQEPGVPDTFYRSPEAVLSDVKNILAILRNLISHQPARGRAILRAAFGDKSDPVQIVSGVVAHLSTADEAADVTVAAIELLASMLSCCADDIWAYLRSSDIIFPSEKSVTLPIWGSKSSNPNRSSILLQDKARGTYARTIACLELMRPLVTEAQWTAKADADGSTQTKSAVLHRATRWLLDSLLPAYGSWKYKSVRDQTIIGKQIASTLEQILQEAGVTSNTNLQSSVDLVLQRTLLQEGSTHLSAIFGALFAGYHQISALSRLGHTLDATLAEQSAAANLGILNRILSLSRQLQDSQNVITGEVDQAFKRFALEAASNIYVITQYAVSGMSDSLATQAVILLTMLCRASSQIIGDGESFSLLSHLGSVIETDRFVDTLLELAGNPYVESSLQAAVWALLTAISDTQPGLAAILITGKQALAPHLSSSVPASASEGTGPRLALQVVAGWTEAWDVQPNLLSAALTFLVSMWQNYIDSNTVLQKLRMDTKLWEAVGEILQKKAAEERSPDTGITTDMTQSFYAYRRSAQANAASLMAADIRYRRGNSHHGSTSSASVGQFTRIIEDSVRFQCLCEAAMGYLFDDDLVTDSCDRLAEVFPGFQLNQLTQPGSSDSPEYGTDFHYNTAVAKKRLVGSAAAEMLEPSVVQKAIERIRELNHRWSDADAALRALAAVASFLDDGLRGTQITAKCSQSLEKSLVVTLSASQRPKTASTVGQATYAHILQFCKIQLECLARSGHEVTEASQTLVLDFSRAIMTDESFSPQKLLGMLETSHFENALQICYLAFRLCSGKNTKTVSKRAVRDNHLQSSEEVLFECISTYRALLAGTSEGDGRASTAQKLANTSLAICEVLFSPLSPPVGRWLAHCNDLNFFKQAFDVITALAFTEASMSMAFSTMQVLLTMARDPRAAEKIGLDGLMFSLCNNVMTDPTSNTLQHVDSEHGNFRQEQSSHELWLAFISTATQLVCHLGSSVAFMEEDVTTFIQMYKSRMTSALRWTSDSPLTIFKLREFRATLSLISACLKAGTDTELLQSHLHDLIRSSLHLLQHLVYLLQHPNLLTTLLEPLSAAESEWLQGESDQPENVSLTELGKRPVAGSLSQAVLDLCWLEISILNTYAGSFAILTKDRVDWRRARTVLAAGANLSLDEPATIGTLFDLARYASDAGRHIDVSAKALGNVGPSPPLVYDPSRFTTQAAACYEGSLLLMCTQLALTAEQQNAAGDLDRASQRARRDLKELATDVVEEFLEKASVAGHQDDQKLAAVLKAFMLRC